MKYALTLLMFFSTAAPALFAADAPPAPAQLPAVTPASSPAPVTDAAERRGRSGRSGGRRELEERLKTSFPSEYAQMVKLRETDPDAAMVQLRALMRRSSGASETGTPPEAVLAQLKEKFPAEYAAIEERKKTDVAAAAKKLAALLAQAGIKLPEPAPEPASTLRDAGRRTVARVETELRRRNPEGYAELLRLRENDPDAARARFRAMVQEADIKLDQTPLKLEYTAPDAVANNAAATDFRSRSGRGSRSGGWGSGNAANPGARQPWTMR